MIYIITPVFNRKEFTKNYLIALSKQTNQEFKVVIVDDGSTDGTSEMIEENFPDVILLKEKGDLWWAEATNVGVKYAMNKDAKYIMTLNDDTVPEKYFIENMLNGAKIKPNSLIGALAVNYDSGLIHYAGEILSWKKRKTTFLLDILDKDEYYGLHEINLYPGRGLLIPRKVFETIGLYDSKNFPQTVADHDFAIRAVNKGYKIFCNFDARIKTFSDESAMVTIRQNKSLVNYYNHLFGMKGGGNLKWFIKFTLKNAPLKYRYQYMFKGIISRILGYPLEWILGYKK